MYKQDGTEEFEALNVVEIKRNVIHLQMANKILLKSLQTMNLVETTTLLLHIFVKISEFDDMMTGIFQQEMNY